MTSTCSTRLAALQIDEVLMAQVEAVRDVDPRETLLGR